MLCDLEWHSHPAVLNLHEYLSFCFLGLNSSLLSLIHMFISYFDDLMNVMGIAKFGILDMS